MKTILLMRHAKSSWKDTSLADHERPLNKRGEKDAPQMGKILKEHHLVPQMIISSSAVRCSQTAEVVAENCNYKNEITYIPTLYLAESQTILDTLHDTPDEVDRILLIGHNPGLEGLVQILSGRVESMPTGAIAVIQIPIRNWQALNMDIEGKLIDLWRPRR